MKGIRRVIAALGCTFLAACATSGAAFAADQLSFRLDWSIYGTHAPFFLALEDGLYAKQGLDVTINEGQGSGTVVKLIAQGSDPVGFVDYGTMARGVVQGMPVKAVFGVNQLSPMAVVSHADAPIKSPKELEGKIVAMAPAESTAQIFPALLAANHVDAKKISILQPAIGAKNALFLQHRADAIPIYVNVQLAQLEAQGAKLYYFKYADFGVSTLSNGIVANAAWLAKNGDVLKRFLRATSEAWAIARKDPERAVAALIKAKPELKREHDVLLRQLQLTFQTLVTPNTKGEPLGWMSSRDWEQTQDILAKYAGLTGTVPVGHYYTNEYVPR